jgi:signal peptidase I
MEPERGQQSEPETDPDPLPRPAPADTPPDRFGGFGPGSLFYDGPRPAFAPAPPPPEPGIEAPPVAEPGARAGRNRVVREVVETALLALLVFLSFRASVQHFRVDGISMSPTLAHGQFLAVNKLAYVRVHFAGREGTLFHEPRRGDIVVVRDPGGAGVDLVKRIVALPGETIEIRDGRVFISGVRLEEPYIETPGHTSLRSTILRPDQYFVMGDNREHSQDSRVFGPVRRDAIVGQVVFSYWPLSRFGRLEGGAPRLAAR